ncbi:MAG: hypothetical protein GKR89_36490 [Candidatus Latescibacteria bacterium]|nr:hypothetical protein [Candidatus Latescibacterota bacterium]
MAQAFNRLIRPWLFSAALFATPQLWGDTLEAYFHDLSAAPSDPFQDDSTL